MKKARGAWAPRAWGTLCGTGILPVLQRASRPGWKGQALGDPKGMALRRMADTAMPR
jgi:hypothetical protein